MGTMVEIHPDGLERCQDVWDFGEKTQRLRLEMAEGRRRMTIQVECKNERAKRLYERKGFCVTVRDTPDAVLLLKKT